MTRETAECPICGGGMFGLHCKLVCRNCGYREDCSDLFPVEDARPIVRSDASQQAAEERRDDKS